MSNYTLKIIKFLLLLLCMAGICLCGCNSQEKEEQLLLAERLTNLYTGTEYDLPDDWRMVSDFPPEYDPDTGSFLVYAQSSEETEDENGVISNHYSGGFFTVNPDGSVTEHRTFRMPEDSVFVQSGRFTDDAVYLLTSVYDRLSDQKTYALHRIDRETGETFSSTEINAYFDLVNRPGNLFFDGDGNLYLQGTEESISLTSGFVYRFSVQSQTPIRSMAESPDGSVWICTSVQGDFCAAKIDTETGNPETFYPLTEEAQTLLSAPAESGYAFYFLDNTAIYGAGFDEEGKFITEEKMDLLNSGILNDIKASGGRFTSSAFPAAVFGTESFLFMQMNREGEKMIPVLYRRAEDLDVNSIRSITIAYTEPLAAEYSAAILDFNRTHPEVQIIMQDYTVYAEEDAPDAAEEKLAFDLVNGFCKPDIVIGSAYGSDMEQIHKNHLYTDLTQYLQTDTQVNFDTLFGCIPRVFDDGNGGMWGISPVFQAETLLTTREILGEYGKNGYWNLEEMLNFLDSLPAGVEGIANASSAWTSLPAQGDSMFIDRETWTCSFDSGLFQRYLTYLAGLPKNKQELQRTSAYAQMTTEEQYYARLTGQVALEPYNFWSQADCLILKAYFNSEEYVTVGYASETDSGTIVTPGITCVITSFTENPDVCWELIRKFFEIREFALGTSILSMKPLMQEYFSRFEDRDIIYYLNGFWESRKRDPENPLTEEQLTKPGVIVDFTEDDRQRLWELFDRAGTPIIYNTPAGVADIVGEEVSAFLTGMGTAEECAEKIQSRAEIWLAEHE